MYSGVTYGCIAEIHTCASIIGIRLRKVQKHRSGLLHLQVLDVEGLVLCIGTGFIVQSTQTKTTALLKLSTRPSSSFRSAEDHYTEDS